MKLNEKIILLRGRRGWSQEELSYRLGVSRQAISKWETGESVPEIDKITKMSDLFGVCTDYLLKDGWAEDQMAVGTDGAACTGNTEDTPDIQTREVSDEEGEHYLTLSKRLARRIAIAVVMCIVCPVCLILFAGLSEAGLFLQENAACGLGLIILLLLVAGAVFIFVNSGMQLSPYEYLDTEKIVISDSLRRFVTDKKKAFQPRYTAAVTAGVVLCILAILPIFVAMALDASDLISICCTAAIFPIVAIAVFLFVTTGNMQAAYQKLLQEQEYTPKRKSEKKDGEAALPSIYWSVVTAAYLLVSFITRKWDMTWIIWPVAGVLYGALYTVVTSITNQKKK